MDTKAKLWVDLKFSKAIIKIKSSKETEGYFLSKTLADKINACKMTVEIINGSEKFNHNSVIMWKGNDIDINERILKPVLFIDLVINIKIIESTSKMKK